MKGPRKPTNAELSAISKYMCKKYDLDYEEEFSILQDSAIAVFENYITDGPGYSGTLYMAVFPGSPSFYTVFTVHPELGLQEQECEFNVGPLG